MVISSRKFFVLSIIGVILAFAIGSMGIFVWKINHRYAVQKEIEKNRQGSPPITEKLPKEKLTIDDFSNLPIDNLSEEETKFGDIVMRRIKPISIPVSESNIPTPVPNEWEYRQKNKMNEYYEYWIEHESDEFENIYKIGEVEIKEVVFGSCGNHYINCMFEHDHSVMYYNNKKIIEDAGCYPKAFEYFGHTYILTRATPWSRAPFILYLIDKENQSIKRILESKPVDTYSIIGFHNHEEGLIIKACMPEKTCIIYLIVNGILRDQKEFSFESF